MFVFVAFTGASLSFVVDVCCFLFDGRRCWCKVLFVVSGYVLLSLLVVVVGLLLLFVACCWLLVDD